MKTETRKRNHTRKRSELRRDNRRNTNISAPTFFSSWRIERIAAVAIYIDTTIVILQRSR